MTMNFTKALIAIATVIIFHVIGTVLGLYGLLPWYDIPMHFGGGFAMGCLGLAIWYEGIYEVRFKKRFEWHLRWWFVPMFVLGFVALISIGWEWHEFLLDQWFSGQTRQVGLADTMADFFFDLLGGGLSYLLFYLWYAKS